MRTRTCCRAGARPSWTWRWRPCRWRRRRSWRLVELGRRQTWCVRLCRPPPARGERPARGGEFRVSHASNTRSNTRSPLLHRSSREGWEKPLETGGRGASARASAYCLLTGRTPRAKKKEKRARACGCARARAGADRVCGSMTSRDSPNANHPRGSVDRARADGHPNRRDGRARTGKMGRGARPRARVRRVGEDVGAMFVVVIRPVSVTISMELKSSALDGASRDAVADVRKK